MWKGFQKPKRLASELESLTEKYGRFSAQPFERGWGTTVGNGLRRALLELHRRRGHHRRQDRRRAARIFFDPRRGRGCHRHHPQPEAGAHQAEHRPAEDHLPQRRAARPGHLGANRGRRGLRGARQERVHRHRQRRRQAADRNARQERPRLRRRRPQLRRRPAHRLHPGGQRSLAGAQSELLRRSRASRPDDRLRKADDRSVDQRRHHAAGLHRPRRQARQGPHEHLHQLRRAGGNHRSAARTPRTIRASSTWTAPSKSSSFPCAPTTA